MGYAIINYNDNGKTNSTILLSKWPLAAINYLLLLCYNFSSKRPRALNLFLNIGFQDPAMQ